MRQARLRVAPGPPVVEAMSTSEFSIPEALRAIVEEQVARRDYASSDEYLRELIRRDQDLQRLRGLLLAGAESGPGQPVDFDALRARILA